MTLNFFVVDENLLKNMLQWQQLYNDLPNLYKINWTLVLVANPICLNLSTKSQSQWKPLRKFVFISELTTFFLEKMCEKNNYLFDTNINLAQEKNTKYKCTHTEIVSYFLLRQMTRTKWICDDGVWEFHQIHILRIEIYR